jgi:hypothetical protein
VFPVRYGLDSKYFVDELEVPDCVIHCSGLLVIGPLPVYTAMRRSISRAVSCLSDLQGAGE